MLFNLTQPKPSPLSRTEPLVHPELLMNHMVDLRLRETALDCWVEPVTVSRSSGPGVLTAIVQVTAN